MPIITIVDYSLVEKKEKVSGLPDPGNEKLLKSVQLLHLQTMRLGVLKPYQKSVESMRPTMFWQKWGILQVSMALPLL